jgi:hypothetical protein
VTNLNFIFWIPNKVTAIFVMLMNIAFECVYLLFLEGRLQFAKCLWK